MERTLAYYPRLLQADKLNVMVVGRGGREHALAWKLARSERIGNLYVAPGIAGVERGVINKPIDGRDNRALVQFAQAEKVDLVVVGSISALARGLVDDMEREGIPAFGPTKSAMRLESSKPYAKRLMQRSGILTPPFGIFTDEQLAEAHAYVESNPGRLYVKAGGFAGGEGAIACETPELAHAAIKTILVDRRFPDAGNEIVIEKWTDGLQVAFSAFAAGTSYQVFPAQGESYKPRYDGDIGLNTGGMGTYGPADWFGPEQVARAAEQIIHPALAAMAREGNPFRGIIMPEFIVTPEGYSVHEINARFGGPEAQVDMRNLKSDLLEIFVAAMAGTLDETPLVWDPVYSIGVNTAARGYPGNFERGALISGIDAANEQEGVVVFHNGVKEEDGELYTNGGCPLTVTAVGATLSEARDRVYAALEEIDYVGMSYRTDIGLDPQTGLPTQNDVVNLLRDKVEDVNALTIRIDSINDMLQDFMRGRRGSHEETLANIDRYVAMGHPVEAQIEVFRLNYSTVIDTFADLYSNHGVRRFAFNLGREEEQVDPVAWRALVEQLSRSRHTFLEMITDPEDHILEFKLPIIFYTQDEMAYFEGSEAASVKTPKRIETERGTMFSGPSDITLDQIPFSPDLFSHDDYRAYETLYGKESVERIQKSIILKSRSHPQQ